MIKKIIIIFQVMKMNVVVVVTTTTMTMTMPSLCTKKLRQPHGPTHKCPWQVLVRNNDAKNKNSSSKKKKKKKKKIMIKNIMRIINRYQQQSYLGKDQDAEIVVDHFILENEDDSICLITTMRSQQ